MMCTIKRIIFLCLLFPFEVFGQGTEVLPLDTILQRIDAGNVLLQTYGLRAEGYQYRAEAATAWMAPMVGAGTFMTPYPGQTLMDGRDKGSLMLRIEQDIPGRAKLKARKRYIASQGRVEEAGRAVTLNDLKAQARRQYYSWQVALRRIRVLEQGEKIMQTMKKVEEVRYPYNRSRLGSIYKAEARIENNRNMIRMQQGEIARARGYLNALMNRPGATPFEIDSSFYPNIIPAGAIDTAALAGVRGDVRRMNEAVRSMELNIESMRLERKPDFRIVFDHMAPVSRYSRGGMNEAVMPRAFSVMGMVSIPIAPWASKMYRSGIRAMELDVRAMEKERAGMLLESQGMLYGMQQEIRSMEQRILATEEKVIPALQKALDTYYLNYQENKLELTVVIDAWEALNMMQLSVEDDRLKLYQMIVDYEKELYR